MLQWFVSSWAVGPLSKLMLKHTLGQDLAPFGWMMLSVTAQSWPCLTVDTVDGVKATVIMVRMLG